LIIALAITVLYLKGGLIPIILYLLFSFTLDEQYHAAIVLPLFYLSIILYTLFFKREVLKVQLRFYPSSLLFAVTHHAVIFSLVLFTDGVSLYPITILNPYIIYTAEAILEEIYFRKILYEELERILKHPMLISSLLFALFHIPLYNLNYYYSSLPFLITYFEYGYALQLSMAKKGLIYSIIAHIIHNLISLNYSIPLSTNSFIIILLAYTIVFLISLLLFSKE
ncbi:MAG: hypothetical protein DRP08_06745, partial [Candidatus Aenigmatarchaeota archaeon]